MGHTDNRAYGRREHLGAKHARRPGGWKPPVARGPRSLIVQDATLEHATPMNRDTEYVTLREEIMADREREWNIISLSVTATAALLGFGFSATPQAPMMFLTPLPILMMALIQLKNVMYASLTKAVHLRVTIESRNPQLNWEHCIYLYRCRLRRSDSRGHPMVERAAQPIAIIVMGVLCCVLTVYYAAGLNEQAIALACLALWLGVSFVVGRQIARVVSGQCEKDLERLWQEFLHQLRAQGAGSSTSSPGSSSQGGVIDSGQTAN